MRLHPFSRRLARALVALAALPLASAAARAQAAPADSGVAGVAADRPGFTTGPTLLARGQRQVESGYSFARAGAERSQAVGEVLVRVGVFSRAELRIALNSFELSSSPQGHASGLADAGIATKVRLARGGDGLAHPALAVIAGASVPSGARATAHHASEPQGTLSAAWSLPANLSLTANAGAASLDAGGGAREARYAGGASLAFPLAARLGAYAELSQSWTRAPGSVARYLNGGVTILPGRAAQLDAWTAVGLHHGAPDYALGMGVVRRW